MTLYERLVKVLTPEQIDHWQSDLYVKVTPESKKIVEEFRNLEDASKRITATTFKDQINNELWYEIAFAYDPYWIEKCRGEE